MKILGTALLLSALLATAVGCGESKVISTSSGQGGGNGAQAGGPGAGFRAGFIKFRACMTSHGVKLPSRQPGQGGPPGGPSGSLNSTAPNFQKALQACRSQMPSPGGNGGPGGGPSGPGGNGPGPPNGYDSGGFVPPGGAPGQ